MKKLMKRIGAVLMAVAMMAALGVSAWADGEDPVPETPETPETTTVSVDLNDIPKSSDTGTVTISGLKDGDTVKFYQVVKANYDSVRGFDGYEAVADRTINIFDTDGKTVIYPSAEQITALANDPSKLTTTVDASSVASGGKVAQALAAGEWMAIITSVDGSVVYNPVLVSVYYTDSGKKITTEKEVSADKDHHYAITSDQAYAKSSPITIDKKITDDTDHNVEKEGGDALAVGDTVNFAIDSTIPSYSADYTKVTYKVTDELSTGLTLNKAAGDIKVSVGGSDVAESNDTWTLTSSKLSDRGFEIAFAESYLKGLANLNDAQRKLVVTYSAVLNNDAQVNMADNDNTAKIEYTNKPDENGTTKTIEDKTHQYTFSIDGLINGTGTQQNKDVWKSGEVTTSSTDVAGPLSGAKFGLFSDSSCNTPVKNKVVDGTTVTDGTDMETTTDAAGLMEFSGLDVGTYYLKEIEAPDGYALNNAVTQIDIAATFNDDGTLKEYTVTMTDTTDGTRTATSTYTADYTANPTEPTITRHEGEYEIKNTKTPNLPSTGGIGTYVFTIAGVAIMAIAAGLLIVRNKKKAE